MDGCRRAGPIRALATNGGLQVLTRVLNAVVALSVPVVRSRSRRRQPAGPTG